MSTKQMEQLDAEIEQMEAALVGKPTDKTGTTSDNKETSGDQTDNEEALQEQHSKEEDGPSQEELSHGESEDDNTEDAEPTKQKNNWKKRYTSLRSYHDAQMFELRSELSRMKSSVLDLKKSNALLSDKLSSDNDSSFITDEERAILGDDAVNVLMKVHDKSVAPIKEQLAAEREARLKADEVEVLRSQATAKNLFVERLERLVPTYESIDTDPAFLKWMDGQDEWSGVERKTLFQRAVQNGDVGRAAEFYVVYHNMTTKTPKDNLANKVGPTGTRNSMQSSKESDSGNDEVSMAFINQFYNDVSRGKYKGRMALQNEIEAKIDKAVSVGRVRK